MAALGIQREKIALVFKIAEKTLRRHCRVELDTGEVWANYEVGKFLMDAATGKETYVMEDGSVGLRDIGVTRATITAAIFWMKTRANWREMFCMATRAPAARSRSSSGKPTGSFEVTAKLLRVAGDREQPRQS